LAEGYNRGTDRSRGDLLVFSHDDIEILTPQFVPRLKWHLESHDLVGVAGTTRLVDGGWRSAGNAHLYGQVAQVNWKHHRFDVLSFGDPSTAREPVQALDGLFLACKRAVLESIHFDEETFDGFHLYDLDFTFAAYLAGMRLAVCGDLPILHYSAGIYGEVWDRYAQRFVQKYRGKLGPKNPYASKIPAARATTKTEVVALMEGRFDQRGNAARLFHKAAEHVSAGRLPEAERCYRQILAADPHHAEAWHQLGVAAHRTGRYEVAADMILQAVDLAPANPIYWTDLAAAYHGQGNFNRAEECLREAMRLYAEHPPPSAT